MVGHMISAIITKIQMVYLDDALMVYLIISVTMTKIQIVYLDDALMILLDHKCNNNKNTDGIS